jgi:tRNA pseudouridine55 synthase
MGETDEIVHGLLLAAKPAGMTSHDVIDRVEPWFPRGQRIGHTGTLDPLATGVLVLCLGQATRLAEYIQRMEKTYESVFLLGQRSDTDDADGTITVLSGASDPGRHAVEEALSRFVGRIVQVPPAYSAARIAGRRAHRAARSGERVTLAARQVTVNAIEILGYAYPHLRVRIRCSRGTYVRAIARDLGGVLGCGGMVETLVRECIGPFTLAECLALDANPERARRAVRPMTEALGELPRLELDVISASRFGQGQPVPIAANKAMVEAAVFCGAHLIGVGRFDSSAGLLHPHKVIG